MNICEVKNGSYACQLETGHAGRHRGIFKCGRMKSRRYNFADKYSAVIIGDVYA